MKGYRFYAELDGNGIARGLSPRTTVKQLWELSKVGTWINCTAILLPEAEHRYANTVECVGAVYGWPNSPCTLTSVCDDVRRKWRRVPEALARELHPQLFVYLESD